MIILLFANKFPESWEPSNIWYLAAIEGLIIDAPLLGMLVRAVQL